MYAAKRVMESFENRMEMCKRAFEQLSSASTFVRVLPIEKVVNEYFHKDQNYTGRVGTVDILEYLRDNCYRESDIEITLIVGGDTYNDLVAGKWKRVSW